MRFPSSPIQPAGGGCVRKPQRCRSPTSRETPPPPPPEPSRAASPAPAPWPCGVQSPQPGRAHPQLCRRGPRVPTAGTARGARAGTALPSPPSRSRCRVLTRFRRSSAYSAKKPESHRPCASLADAPSGLGSHRRHPPSRAGHAKFAPIPGICRPPRGAGPVPGRGRWAAGRARREAMPQPRPGQPPPPAGRGAPGRDGAGGERGKGRGA